MGAQLSKIASKWESDFWAFFGLKPESEFGFVGVGSIVRCGVLSFLAYYVPLSLMRGRADPFVFRSAVAFSVFSFAYRSLRLLEARFVSQRNEFWHVHGPFVSGAAAALIAQAIDPTLLSSLFIVWWSIRALRTLPLVDHFSHSRFGPAMVMMFAVDLLGPSALLSPEDHHPSYRSFITKFFGANGDDPKLFKGPYGEGKSLANALTEKRGNIIKWLLGYFLGAFKESVRMYLPLHLLWAAFRLPARTDFSVIASNTLRSSVFLAAYTGSLMTFLLINSSLVRGVPARWHLHLWAWLGGLSVLIERQNRQAELAFYCLAHGVNALISRLKLRGYSLPRAAQALLLMLATGQIMKHNALHPGRTMHLLFGEKLGRKTQLLSQQKDEDEGKEGATSSNN